MPRQTIAPGPARDTLLLKLGGWLEAQATGHGVIVLGVIVFALLAAGVAQLALR